MRIVFGWYTFRIKTYTPQDLNIHPESPSFEVRQRIFHLFWIPAFPIGKVYAFKKDKELYHAPEQIKAQIRLRKDYRTPWYAYSLPILAVVVFLFSMFASMQRGYSQHENAVSLHEASVHFMDNELAHLTPHHYIRLTTGLDHYSSENYFLKVFAVNGSSVQLLKSDVTNADISPYLLMKYFSDNKDSLEKITLPLESLKKAVCRDFDVYQDSNDFGENLLDDGKKYSVESVDYYDGPEIQQGSSSLSGDQISLGLANIGEPAVLVAIKNIKGRIKWNNELPMEVPLAEHISGTVYLEGSGYDNGVYEVELVLEDSLRKQHRFIMDGQGLTRTITRVK